MRQSQQLQKPGVGGGGRIQSQTSVQWGCFQHCCDKLSWTARATHQSRGERDLGKILYWIMFHNKATWLFKSFPPSSVWSARTILSAFYWSVWRRFWQNRMNTDAFLPLSLTMGLSALIHSRLQCTGMETETQNLPWEFKHKSIYLFSHQTVIYLEKYSVPSYNLNT